MIQRCDPGKSNRVGIGIVDALAWAGGYLWIPRMNSTSKDLDDLIEQIRVGSETASGDFVSRYGTHILRIVRYKLHRSLRPKFDSQDFVQAVWASFFALLPGRPGFDGPDELIAFLSEMARNKVVDAVRQRMQGEKYNVNREQSLDPDYVPSHDGLRVRQPTPEEIAIARDEWQHLLHAQPDEYRRILELLRSGHGRQEVARQLGVSEKTIHRVIHKLSPKPAHESR